MYAKLKLADMLEEYEGEPEASRQTLSEFLTRLEQVVKSTHGDESRPVLGTDPRSVELARKYVASKKRHADVSGLYQQDLAHVRGLLQAEEHDDLRDLVLCLQDIRQLVEQHIHGDANSLLGDI
ncbi:MAG: hypothetical protein AAF846_21370 [Chloroflexota bacterium]